MPPQFLVIVYSLPCVLFSHFPVCGQYTSLTLGAGMLLGDGSRRPLQFARVGEDF